MTDAYNFSVDKKLLVNSWDEHITEFTGEPASLVKGAKYYHVFPRLFFKDRDAVAFSIEKKRKIILEKYIIHCLFYRVRADVIIKPLLAAKEIAGAAIKVTNVSTCEGYRPEDIQRLIAMGKKASTLAHGVRNPLNALKGAVTHISQKYSQEKVLLEFSRLMQEEIYRLDNFISGFLDTSISDTRSSAVDINSLLKRIEILISFQVNAQNISNDFVYGTIPPALINPFQIEQAILNIINNAVEAINSEGKLTVTTTLEKTSERDFIVVEVVDNGPGVPKNRYSNNTTKRKKGKGFGLFITEEIMNYYNGRLKIQSVKGRGTSAKLYIPAYTAGGTNE
ncbi:MAG: hypothetical protein A2X59_10735 [Nitrospirae bacterium GWC2_42_7]|nr:MAG: hypothetical protein A2X59_10735 [Nitrospirae bacterium GWC2_42_7]